ncbi:MAG TPA: 3-oxoacyl-[acyl-carrier-protein] synthase III C-terminal domain-containing protein [Terracidiphilus sp.]|nr:3-oxoacyl-[acyl-carrier-protein] synthase III C-terminal domain-containing protein [Terracidiphilus sp.]
MTTAYLNRIATAVPPHDMHSAFVSFAQGLLSEGTPRNLYRRMVRLSAIDHRYSFLKPIVTEGGEMQDEGALFVRGNFPSTARRMEAFREFAPQLARCALLKLALTDAERRAITHVIVTCCTGLYAPGLDFEMTELLHLNPSVERTFIGFMGCYAAINALKTARHIVRSEPESKVLLLSLELCSLHMQETQDLEQLLAFTVFADGCAAYVVTAEPAGFALDSFLAVNLPGSDQLITWRIGEQGFDMHLSGQVPGQLRQGLAEAGTRITHGREISAIDLWAIHPGGRTILDAAEKGLALPAEALADSRNILLNYGNMSSASIMFVLQRLMQRAIPGQVGCAMSFGPGVTAETMMFHAV